MHVLVASTKPFRMPHFLLISGLFRQPRHRPPPAHPSRPQAGALSAIFVPWATIHFSFKAPALPPNQADRICIVDLNR